MTQLEYVEWVENYRYRRNSRLNGAVAEEVLDTIDHGVIWLKVPYAGQSQHMLYCDCAYDYPQRLFADFNCDYREIVCRTRLEELHEVEIGASDIPLFREPVSSTDANGPRFSGVERMILRTLYRVALGEFVGNPVGDYTTLARLTAILGTDADLSHEYTRLQTMDLIKVHTHEYPDYRIYPQPGLGHHFDPNSPVV